MGGWVGGREDGQGGRKREAVRMVSRISFSLYEKVPMVSRISLSLYIYIYRRGTPDH